MKLPYQTHASNMFEKRKISGLTHKSDLILNSSQSTSRCQYKILCFALAILPRCANIFLYVCACAWVWVRVENKCYCMNYFRAKKHKKSLENSINIVLINSNWKSKVFVQWKILWKRFNDSLCVRVSNFFIIISMASEFWISLTSLCDIWVSNFHPVKMSNFNRIC